MEQKKNTNVKIPLIVTAINFATHLMPLVIMLPLIMLTNFFSCEVEIELLGRFFVFLFLISILIYVIGIAVAPLIQIVLAIVAMVHKKWWLVCVHVVSTIALCGGIALFFMMFERLVHAT